MRLRLDLTRGEFIALRHAVGAMNASAGGGDFTDRDIEASAAILEKIATRSDPESRRLAAAEKLLDAAMWTLHWELSAAGPDEVRENPHLRGIEKLRGKIERFLAKALS